jgi:hypothetical protein
MKFAFGVMKKASGALPILARKTLLFSLRQRQKGANGAWEGQEIRATF